MSDKPERKRIDILDALRGVSILLMVVYHAVFNLEIYKFIPEYVRQNPLVDTLQTIFAGLFIVLAGISSHFSRNNLRRGLIVLGGALLVSVGGFLVKLPIWFGILHFLAVCILLYWLLEKLHIAEYVAFPAAFVLLFFNITEFPPSVITLFGQEWGTNDYFPLVPWVFLFFLGTALGAPIRENKLPKRFYTQRVPFFAAVGRHTLAIFLLHHFLIRILRKAENFVV